MWRLRRVAEEGTCGGWGDSERPCCSWRLLSVFSIAAARAANPGDQAREAAPFGAEVGAPFALLSRLHHAAEREVQLGELAETGGFVGGKPSLRRGAVSRFGGLDQRIVATAASVGVDGRAALGGSRREENVVALKKESDDFGAPGQRAGARLSNRDFWVTVAESQSAESDMLTSTACARAGAARAGGAR